MKRHSDWWASKPGRGMCKKCGEERLVHEVADSRGVQHFCQVCSHQWWVEKADEDVAPLSAAEYRERFA